MKEIAKLYMQYKDGTDDSIVLEADCVEDMNMLIDSTLKDRNAEFTGIECIQQCE